MPPPVPRPARPVTAAYKGSPTKNAARADCFLGNQTAPRFHRTFTFLSGKCLPTYPIHVCRNLYFDKTQRFEIYHTSNAREPIEKNSITLGFPAIGTCVADSFYSNGYPTTALALKIYEIRAELQHWRIVRVKMYEAVTWKASWTWLICDWSRQNMRQEAVWNGSGPSA